MNSRLHNDKLLFYVRSIVRTYTQHLYYSVGKSYSPYGPPMYWHVPTSPKYVDIVRVPPITVKISIGEVQQFTH
ncbi:hypothetical protein M0802_004339 [Mischocyttarus mexicanus]|nr:hypothetical protein M0802_004339 [Mischocyttarus mexicanus]